MFLFAATCTISKHVFFFFPPWWEYLKSTNNLGQCVPEFNFPHDILPVGLAIVDMIMRVAGLVAIISVIIGGVGYMTAAGDVAKTASARKRIYNSLIGLAIVSISAGMVAFIGNSLGG